MAVPIALVLLFVPFFINVPPLSKFFLTLVAIFLLGISWASMQAQMRLADELPHALK